MALSSPLCHCMIFSHLSTASVPELLCGDAVVQEPTQILNFMRKQVSVCSLNICSEPCSKTCRFTMIFFIFPVFLQRFNADYDLTARQGADTMAYVALLEEKLRPALVTASDLCSLTERFPFELLLILIVMFCVPQLHTFWVDAENYTSLTRPWFASRSPFPLNFVVPSRHANIALSRILLTKGEAPLHRISEVEGRVNTYMLCSFLLRVSCPQVSLSLLLRFFTLPQIYSDAKECLNLLSYRLGAANYFFGNS